MVVCLALMGSRESSTAAILFERLVSGRLVVPEDAVGCCWSNGPPRVLQMLPVSLPGFGVSGGVLVDGTEEGV